MGKVPKADGVIQLTLSNPSSSLALSLAVYKFSSLAEFICWLGKAEQLPLLWGGRSCVSIANNRFGEGVHPVRVNTRHCEGGKCIELGGQPIRHCEACEARRGNPVEQRLNLLDCFTTFAMTTTVTNYSTFLTRLSSWLSSYQPIYLPLQPFNYSTNTPSLESEVPCLA